MAASNEPEWTDDDFVPRDDPDPIESLRREIQERLAQGVKDDEIVEELVRRGLEQMYVLQLIDSVRKIGKYRELELGTELYQGGRLIAFYKDPLVEKKLRLEARQRRREREAREGVGGPNSALDFGPIQSPYQEVARPLSRRPSRLLLLVIFVLASAGFLSAIALLIFSVGQ